MLVFGVFTSETTLSKWTDRETAFMAMPARAVLDLAETHSFGRIVIDSDQETMFVLERNRENISTTTIQEETQVQVGFPQHPIDGANKSQLLAAFSKNSNIKDVYHFVMLRNLESIYILAFVLENYSENARLAVMDCVSDGMKGFALDLPLESMYIEESASARCGDIILDIIAWIESISYTSSVLDLIKPFSNETFNAGSCFSPARISFEPPQHRTQLLFYINSRIQNFVVLNIRF